MAKSVGLKASKTQARKKELISQAKILKQNIKNEEDMVKNNKSYTNSKTGKTFTPSHYKQALKYDKEQLKNTRKKIRNTK